MGHTDRHVTAEQGSKALFEKSYELAQEGKINLKFELFLF